MSLIPPLRVTQLQMELRRNWRREQALQGLPQNRVTHVPRDGRETDPKNLKALRLSAWLACWFEACNYVEVPRHR